MHTYIHTYIHTCHNVVQVEARKPRIYGGPEKLTRVFQDTTSRDPLTRALKIPCSHHFKDVVQREKDTLCVCVCCYNGYGYGWAYFLYTRVCAPIGNRISTSCVCVCLCVFLCVFMILFFYWWELLLVFIHTRMHAYKNTHTHTHIV
jgi:hypothetical protein